MPEHTRQHLVHDTVTKTYRHLNFFHYQCDLEARVKLPDGKVLQVTPPWAGNLSDFSLLFEAFVLLMAREMPFSGVARVAGKSIHRVMTASDRYVDAAVATADLSQVRRVAIDETSRAKGQAYMTLLADADPDPERRRVLFVAEGREADTVGAFAANLHAHYGTPSEITFDKFHVIALASEPIDATRRAEQNVDPG